MERINKNKADAVWRWFGHRSFTCVCVLKPSWVYICVKKFVHKGLGVRGLLNIPELTARVCISTIFFILVYKL